MSYEHYGIVWSIDFESITAKPKAGATVTVALGSSDRETLLALAEFANKIGECWPGVDRLAYMTGRKPRAVKESLRRLREAGLIEIVSGRGGGRRSDGKGIATKYRLSLANGVRKPEYEEWRRMQNSAADNTDKDVADNTHRVTRTVQGNVIKGAFERIEGCRATSSNGVADCTPTSNENLPTMNLPYPWDTGAATQSRQHDQRWIEAFEDSCESMYRVVSQIEAIEASARHMALLAVVAGLSPMDILEHPQVLKDVKAQDDERRIDRALWFAESYPEVVKDDTLTDAAFRDLYETAGAEWRRAA